MGRIPGQSWPNRQTTNGKGGEEDAKRCGTEGTPVSLSPNLIAAPSMASPYIVTRQSFQGCEGRSWQLTSRTSDLARAKPTLACNLRHHQCPLLKFKFTKPCLTRLLAFFPTPTPTPPKPHSTCPPYSKQALASPSVLPICSPLCTAPPSPGLPPPPARAWEHLCLLPYPGSVLPPQRLHHQEMDNLSPGSPYSPGSYFR